jgi:hypothetical protein
VGNAWTSVRIIATPPAAITLLHQLEMPLNPDAGHWILNQMHPSGGFLAMPMAPIPDLLSTATALHALACLVNGSFPKS